MSDVPITLPKDTDQCSFCGKKRTEVKHLLGGSTRFICDECVQLHYDILKEVERKAASAL